MFEKKFWVDLKNLFQNVSETKKLEKKKREKKKKISRGKTIPAPPGR